MYDLVPSVRLSIPFNVSDFGPWTLFVPIFVPLIEAIHVFDNLGSDLFYIGPTISSKENVRLKFCIELCLRAKRIQLWNMILSMKSMWKFEELCWNFILFFWILNEHFFDLQLFANLLICKFFVPDEANCLLIFRMDFGLSR